MAHDERLTARPLPGAAAPSRQPPSRPDTALSAVAAPWAHFNFFQRMMLRWRDLHPYNPVHVVRVPVALDAQRLRAAIAAGLESSGLTGMAVDRARWRYRYEGGPAQVDLSVLPGGDDAPGLLARTIESEFNRPFEPAAHEQPFRFIAIDEGGSFQLLLVYDHYVAGGDSIVRLLTRLACTMARPEHAAPPLRLGRASAGYRRTLLSHPGWLLRSLLDLPRTVADARRAWRVPHAHVEDGTNAYLGVQLDAARTAALRAAALAWGVTSNDLLAACLMRALSPLAARRRDAPRRQQLAVASILNMRRDQWPDARDALPPFLAAFRVSHAVPEGIGLQSLAQAVHQQTSRIKRNRLYLHSLLGLGLSAVLWPWLSPLQRQNFYPKHFAVWAGITSLDVDLLWGESQGAATAGFDYLRAVPTGPLCPLVLAVTRVHDQLRLGFAFRTSAFSRETVASLAAAMLRQADELPGGPAP